MTELIHMTATYSNAVLVAILPFISDFAKKLALPTPQPIAVSNVTEFRPMPLKGYIGGGVQVSNFLFSYSMGCVNSFRSSDNVFYDQDPTANWPKYAYGKDNMTTNGAIALARESLRKLGYPPELLGCHVPPKSVTGPYDTKDGNHVPHCQIRWESIPEPKSPEESKSNDIVTVEINMEKKTITGLHIASQKIWRTPPNVDIQPQLERDYKKQMGGTMFLRTNAPASLR
jgi:hypothetical protein